MALRPDFTPRAYLTIEPVEAYAHLPRKARREALRAREKALRGVARMIAAGNAQIIDENEIPADGLVFRG